MNEVERRIDDPMRFTGDRIRQVRRSRQRGVTQLAESVGLSAEELGAMERGESPVGSDVLCALADELAVPPSVLRGYHVAGQVTADPDGIERTLAEIIRTLEEVLDLLLQEAEGEVAEETNSQVIQFPGGPPEES
jgi:transcriptional regulator with XRE-family HTH domain